MGSPMLLGWHHYVESVPCLNNILCYFDIQFIVPHKHFYGLWFDVEMYSCRSGGSVVDMRRS